MVAFDAIGENRSAVVHLRCDDERLFTRKSGKHAIKQIDRLLSNQGIDVWALFPLWIKETIGASRDLIVAMDWTEFDADDQSTLALNLLTRHGRAQPLLWFSVFKAELTGKRNDIEDMCLARLKEALPEGTKVTILADRGFGDVSRHELLKKRQRGVERIE